MENILHPIGCLDGSKNTVKLKSILVGREREREAPVETPSSVYTYFPVIILRANQTLEIIFRHIFQNATKQLKMFFPFHKRFSSENNLCLKTFYIKLNPETHV